MNNVIRYIARSMQTSSPVPFGALIVETCSGRILVRSLNAVRPENDPSSHAE
jgi:tRNA(Arg) A34 adenosine deaminase TadA